MSEAFYRVLDAEGNLYLNDDEAEFTRADAQLIAAKIGGTIERID
jgi:hypothetical protein